MKIISSQHYIDWDIVTDKMGKIRNAESVTIPCYAIGEIDGEAFAIQFDGHHTLAAARELGKKVEFALIPDPEGVTGEEALDVRWHDGDWYDVETSNPAYCKFDLIW